MNWEKKKKKKKKKHCKNMRGLDSANNKINEFTCSCQGLVSGVSFNPKQQKRYKQQNNAERKMLGIIFFFQY